MDPGFAITASPVGLVLAAAAVALGAPMFSDGLRALRLRRHFAKLEREPLTPSTNGFAHVRGLVALESPLFSPLAALPCAGFVLEIEGERTALRRVVEVRRNFRLVDQGIAARVPGAAGRWDIQTGATRRVAADEPLSENLAALIGQVPEAMWLRERGVALLLRERVLGAGTVCHVVGTVRSADSLVYAEGVSVVRTGTDDLPVEVAAPEGRIAGGAPAELAIHSGEHLDFLLVSDREPDRERLRISGLRAMGVVLGPALTLSGMLYLAAVADRMRSVGRL